jgi:hypothetical protein
MVWCAYAVIVSSYKISSRSDLRSLGNELVQDHCLKRFGINVLLVIVRHKCRYFCNNAYNVARNRLIT